MSPPFCLIAQTDRGEVHNRLYRHAKKHEESRQKFAERSKKILMEEQCTFAPTISARSKDVMLDPRNQNREDRIERYRDVHKALFKDEQRVRCCRC